MVDSELMNGADETPARNKYANTQRKPRSRGNGEGTVYEFERKLPSGQIWRGYRAKETIRHGENRIRVSGQGRTRPEAREALQRAITNKRIALGEIPDSYLKLQKPDAIRTVAHCSELWLEKTKNSIRLNSWKGYNAKMRLYIVPKFGQTAIRLLKADDLETYFYVELPAIKSKTGKPLGESSIRSTYWTLNAMLEYALKRGWIDKNPLVRVDPPQRRKITRDEEKTLKQAANWTAQHTLEKLQGRDDEARWLLAFIGLRQSEVLGLQLSSLKERRGNRGPLLEIDHQLVYETADHGCGYDNKGEWACGDKSDVCPDRVGVAGFRLAEELKTSEGHRALPLTDRMYDVLHTHKKRQRALQKSKAFKPLDGLENLMFTTKSGQPIRHQTDRNAWKKLLVDFEVKYDLRLHHARHFAASMLIQNKSSMNDIQMILGWSKRSVESMLATYGHTNKALLLTDAMEDLDAKMYSRVDKAEAKRLEERETVVGSVEAALEGE